MKRLSIISLAIFFFSCSNNETACDINATLLDYTGFDGCGFVLEIVEEGKKKKVLDLEALKGWGSFGWGRIIFNDGMKVRISYEQMNDMDKICLTLPIVNITCMEKI